MKLVDANLLLYAAIPSAPQHQKASEWFDAEMNGGDGLALPWSSLMAFLRVSTDSRIWTKAIAVETALEYVQDWLEWETVWVPEPTANHFALVAELLRAAPRSKLVPGRPSCRSGDWSRTDAVLERRRLPPFQGPPSPEPARLAGKSGPRSDIDVAVYLRDGVDVFETHLRLAGVLERALGTDAIDLVVLNTAPLSLAGRILTTRRVLVDQQPHQRHLFESLTVRQFVDFRFREHRLLEMMTRRG